MGDPATGQSISINLGATSTNSLSASVSVAVVHCPPGGSLAALEVAFRNDPADTWSVVHAADTPWPGGDADGCTSGDPTAASTAFAWTLASGASGNRTVYASFKHGQDAVFAQDSITFTAPVTDSTPPTIGYVLNPAAPDGDNSWYKSNVTLTWTVTENESPGSLVKTGCLNQNITADQLETTYSCSATSSGGSAGPVSVSIKRDGTLPTLAAGLNPSSPDGLLGWYTSAPTVTWTCDDNLSGVVTCPSGSTLADGAISPTARPSSTMQETSRHPLGTPASMSTQWRRLSL